MAISKENSSIEIDEQEANNLYRALVTDPKSIFYATVRVTKGLVKKARTSLYPKDKVFVNIYNEIDNSSSRKQIS